jgi:hypothetical protein
MIEAKKREIAASFPSKFERVECGIILSPKEFSIFEKGIFALGMDEKWNIFLLENVLYMARSWTDYCIFKINFVRQESEVLLDYFLVNRDENQYPSKSSEQDEVLLKKMLQFYLQREIYVDSKLNLPLIKKLIEEVDPTNETKKTIGSNTVAITKQIYNRLATEEQKLFIEVIGWIDLKEKISTKTDEEPLISLHLFHKITKQATTYYFDENATELLGEITLKHPG